MNKQPLKILLVASHNAVRAGGAIQMMRLAQGLKELGHDVYCAFNLKHGDKSPGLGSFEPFQNAGFPIFSFYMQRLWKYSGMLKFRRFLKEHRFDVVHAHRFRALRFILQASSGLNLPVFIGNREISYPITPDWASVYGNPKVDAIVVNALLIKELLIQTNKVPSDKIKVIYNGVDLEVFHPGVDGSQTRKSLNIKQDVPVFGMMANIARKKSHTIFFEAAIQVLKEEPEARFLLVGGGDYKAYQKQLAAKGYGEQFIFTGFRTDIPQIISAFDFCVSSSEAGEGLTSSIVESMAMAKPVISTAIAGNTEVVKDKQTGLLVAPGSAEELAKAMLYFIRHRDEVNKIGRNAYEFIKDIVDNRIRSKHFESLYWTILNKKSC